MDDLDFTWVSRYGTRYECAPCQLSRQHDVRTAAIQPVPDGGCAALAGAETVCPERSSFPQLPGLGLDGKASGGMHARSLENGARPVPPTPIEDVDHLDCVHRG